MHRIILLSILLLISELLDAQTTINGRVYDNKTREALVGANVIITGTTLGTVTDMSGEFSLNVNKEIHTEINVSYVGYDPVTVNINNTNYLSIPLFSVYRLDEVVIQAVRGDALRPATRDIISKKQIEKVYVGQDALFVVNNLSPSIISYSESGTDVTNYGLMRLRGIDQSRINITLDGTPLNDMIDQGVFFSNFTDFSNSIESIIHYPLMLV